jgi:hypothetical protein
MDCRGLVDKWTEKGQGPKEQDIKGPSPRQKGQKKALVKKS